MSIIPTSTPLLHAIPVIMTEIQQLHMEPLAPQPDVDKFNGGGAPSAYVTSNRGLW